MSNDSILPVPNSLGTMQMIRMMLVLQLLYATTIAAAGYHREHRLMLDLVNVIRRRNGVPPLSHHDLLMASGHEQSIQQLRRRDCTHDGDLSLWDRIAVTGINPMAVAENVALTYNYDVPEVVGLWERSPGHFKNIVNPMFTYFGSGAVQGHDGAWYWTQHFAKSRGEAPQPYKHGAEPQRPGADTSKGPAQAISGPQQGYFDQLASWWSGTSGSEIKKDTPESSAAASAPNQEGSASGCPYARRLAEQQRARQEQQARQAQEQQARQAQEQQARQAQEQQARQAQEQQARQAQEQQARQAQEQQARQAQEQQARQDQEQQARQAQEQQKQRAQQEQQAQQARMSSPTTAGSDDTCPATDLGQAVRDYSDQAATEEGSNAYNSFVTQLQNPEMIAGMAAIVTGLGLAYVYRQHIFNFVSRGYKSVVGWLRGTTDEKTDDKVAPVLALLDMKSASDGFVTLTSVSSLARFVDDKIGIEEYMNYVKQASTSNKLGLLENLVIMGLSIIATQDLIEVQGVRPPGLTTSVGYQLPLKQASEILGLVARPAIPSSIFGKFIKHSGLMGDIEFMKDVEEKVGRKPGPYQVKALFHMRKRGWNVDQLELKPHSRMSPQFARLVSDLIQYYLHDPDKDESHSMELVERFKKHNEAFKRLDKGSVTAEELRALETLLETSKCLVPALSLSPKCRFINDWSKVYSARKKKTIVDKKLARLATLHSLMDATAFEGDPPMLMWALRNFKGFRAKDVRDPISKVVVKIASTPNPYSQIQPCKFDTSIKTNLIIKPPWEADVAALEGASRRNVTRAIVLWASNIEHPDLLPTPPYGPLSVEELFGTIMASYCHSQVNKRSSAKGMPCILFQGSTPNTAAATA